MEDNFSIDSGVGTGDRGAQVLLGVASEASFACPLLTTCCAAQFLIGHVLVSFLGLGTPDIHNLQLQRSSFQEGMGC